MAYPIPRIEADTTKEFVVTYSAAPGSTPSFALWAGSGDGSLVYSATGVASSSLIYVAAYTMPNTRQLYVYTWTASYAQGPVILRGYVQAVRTIPG